MIKRYDYDNDVYYCSDGSSYTQIDWEENKDGDWCRWGDVKQLIEEHEAEIRSIIKGTP